MKSPSLRVLARSLSDGTLEREAYARRIIRTLRETRPLNAFTAVRSESDIRQAVGGRPVDGPLAGVAFSVKDNVLTRDFPTSAGTALLREFNPGAEASLIAALRELGAVLLGKNNMPEFCQSMTCNNPNFGAVGNPSNRRWIAGGSSSGSAAAVAAGIVAFAVGSDTGGSVRIPAALCGCAGYRPSIGRYSTEGFLPISPTLDTPGLLARRSEDLLWLDQLLAPEIQPAAPELAVHRLRAGIPRAYFYEDLAPAVAKCMDDALATLKRAGVTLIQVELGDVAELNARVGLPIAFYEMPRETAFFLVRHGLGLSLDTLIKDVRGPVERQALNAQLGELAVDRATYVTALTKHWPAWVATIEKQFQERELDFILAPTTVLPAVDHRPAGTDGELNHNGTTASTFLTYIRNTEPFSNYGGPCVTVPAGLANGRPVGLELIGRRRNDRALLAAAVLVEDRLREGD